MSNVRLIDVGEAWLMYQALGSVRKVGQLFGVSGDTVHTHLRKAGYKLNGANWSNEELATIERRYREADPETFSLQAVADELCRPYYGVAIRASRMGISDGKRKKSAGVAAAIRARAKDQWKVKPHPKGFLGGTHSEQSRRKISNRSMAAWQQQKRDGKGNMAPEALQRRSDMMAERQRTDERMRQGYSRGAAGRRKDLGNKHFRSSWEANYARYLNHLITRGKITRWEFEVDTFWFEEIKRGVRSYLPDFKVWPTEGEPYYVEVKGWMDAKSATKLKRMKKYHPHVTVKVVDAKAYSLIDKQFRDVIPNWEGKGRKAVAVPVLEPAPEWLKESA